jgi:hypothetical protein
MVTRSVANIRKEYSHPCRVCLRGSQGYCVGGAICLAHGLDMHFPDNADLARVLQKLNPALDMTTACRCSSLILMYNDRGDFKTAWEVAEYALT